LEFWDGEGAVFDWGVVEKESGGDGRVVERLRLRVYRLRV
jgi:hypothetical protein